MELQKHSIHPKSRLPLMIVVGVVLLSASLFFLKGCEEFSVHLAKIPQSSELIHLIKTPIPETQFGSTILAQLKHPETLEIWKEILTSEEGRGFTSTGKAAYFLYEQEKRKYHCLSVQLADKEAFLKWLKEVPDSRPVLKSGYSIQKVYASTWVAWNEAHILWVYASGYQARKQAPIVLEELVSTQPENGMGQVEAFVEYMDSDPQRAIWLNPSWFEHQISAHITELTKGTVSMDSTLWRESYAYMGLRDIEQDPRLAFRWMPGPALKPVFRNVLYSSIQTHLFSTIPATRPSFFAVCAINTSKLKKGLEQYPNLEKIVHEKLGPLDIQLDQLLGAITGDVVVFTDKKQAGSKSSFGILLGVKKPDIFEQMAQNNTDKTSHIRLKDKMVFLTNSVALADAWAAQKSPSPSPFIASWIPLISPFPAAIVADLKEADVLTEGLSFLKSGEHLSLKIAADRWAGDISGTEELLRQILEQW